MRILVYGINYYPEQIGIGKYTTEMCEWLAAKGNKVDVITGKPFYPHWRIMKPYRSLTWHTEIINRVRIHRCPLYVPTNASSGGRIAHEITFILSSSLYWFRMIFRKQDVVIVIAPPLLLGIPAILYGMIHKAFVVYHIQDLQFDIARDLRMIKNRFVLRGIERLELLILSNVKLVSTISNGMSSKVLKKGKTIQNLTLFPNWADLNNFYPEKKDKDFMEKLGIDPLKKIILYSGNIGEKQGIDIIIDVAKMMIEENVLFVLIGQGAFALRLKELVVRKEIKNILLLDIQLKEVFNKVLNMADIHLVIQKRAAADLVMPSKLINILAVGGVVIATTESGTSLFDLLTTYKIGIIAEPENPKSIYIAIMNVLTNGDDGIKVRSRLYAEQFLDREEILTSFIKTWQC